MWAPYLAVAAAIYPRAFGAQYTNHSSIPLETNSRNALLTSSLESKHDTTSAISHLHESIPTTSPSGNAVKDTTSISMLDWSDWSDSSQAASQLQETRLHNGTATSSHLSTGDISASRHIIKSVTSASISTLCSSEISQDSSQSQQARLQNETAASSYLTTGHHRKSSKKHGTTNTPANGTITAPPSCSSSFVFSGADMWWQCKNCPEANGTWLQRIPENTCSACSDTVWVFTSDCQVHAGKVELTYFATATADGANETLPSTYYDPVLDFTYTSPSVYYRVKTLWATNASGPLGPTASDAIFAFDLSQVSTWMRTTAGQETKTSRGLDLADFEDCPSDKATKQDFSYVENPGNRCNPRLAFPMAFKQYGYPYWRHCDEYRWGMGVWDPPVALTAAASEAKPTLPPTTGISTTTTTTSQTAALRIPVDSGQASKTGHPAQATDEVEGESPVQAMQPSIQTEEQADPPTLIESPTPTGVAGWIAAAINLVKASTATTAPVDPTSDPSQVENVKSGPATLHTSISGIQDGAPTIESNDGAMVVTGSDLFTVRQSDDAVVLAGPSATATLQGSTTVNIGGQVVVGGPQGLILDGSSTVIFSAVTSDKAVYHYDPPSGAFATIIAADQPITAFSTDGGFFLRGASTSVMVKAGETATVASVAFNVDSSGALMAGTSSVSSADAVESLAAGRAVVTGAGGQVFTAVADEESVVVYDSSTTFTLQAGGTATIVGQNIEANLGGGLVVGTSRVSFTDPVESQAAHQAVLTGSNGQVFTAVSDDDSIVVHDSSTTFTLRADRTAIVAGQTVKADPRGHLIVGTSMVSLTVASPAAIQAVVLTASNGEAFTAISKNDGIVVLDGSTTFTLRAGCTTTIAGQTIKATSRGDFIVDSSIVAFSASSTQTADSALVTDARGNVLTVSAEDGHVVVNSGSTTFTLDEGEITTFAGQSLHAVSNGLAVGSSTMTLAAMQSQGAETRTLTGAKGGIYEAIATGASGDIVIEDSSATFTIASGEAFTFAGQILSANDGDLIVGTSRVKLATASTGSDPLTTGAGGQGVKAAQELSETTAPPTTAGPTSTPSESAGTGTGQESGSERIARQLSPGLTLSVALGLAILGLAAGL